MPEAHQEKPIPYPEQPKRSLTTSARWVLFIIGGFVGRLELAQHFILNNFAINLYLLEIVPQPRLGTPTTILLPIHKLVAAQEF